MKSNDIDNHPNKGQGCEDGCNPVQRVLSWLWTSLHTGIALSYRIIEVLDLEGSLNIIFFSLFKKWLNWIQEKSQEWSGWERRLKLSWTQGRFEFPPSDFRKKVIIYKPWRVNIII